MGTPEFAIPSLEAIIKAGHEVALVVTQPDKPAGRGMKLKPTPVKMAAQRLGLFVFQPEKLNAPETLQVIASARPEVIVCDDGQLVFFLGEPEVYCSSGLALSDQHKVQPLAGQKIDSSSRRLKCKPLEAARDASKFELKTVHRAEARVKEF